jgi:hypothetical protein
MEISWFHEYSFFFFQFQPSTMDLLEIDFCDFLFVFYEVIFVS